MVFVNWLHRGLAALGRGEIVLLFACAPMLFAANMLTARWIAGTVPPLTMSFGRWSVAAVLLSPFARRSFHGSFRELAGARLACLGLLGGALSVAPQYAAAAYLSAGHIALIFATTPLLVMLMERVGCKIPLSSGGIAGLLLAFLGISVVTFQGELSHLRHFEVNVGDMLALVAALAWASYTALLRRSPVQLPPVVLIWVVAMWGAVSLLPFMLAEWSVEGVPVLGEKAVVGILILAVVAGIGAYTVYGRLVALAGAARASMSIYLVPVYALLLGAVVLHEPLHPYHLTAAALVLSGVSMATLPFNRIFSALADLHRT
jgi:drug/metabolite transporter (DMT)-like permease